MEELEAAARGDIPVQFATVVGSCVEGDWAIVWLLTNGGPPFEAYQVSCERRDGRWEYESGSGGFGVGTPDEVLDRARRLGWS
jgi:hypothetical protein